MPVVIGGDNLPSPVGIGLTDLPKIGGGDAGGPLRPPAPPLFGRLVNPIPTGGQINPAY